MSWTILLTDHFHPALTEGLTEMGLICHSEPDIQADRLRGIIGNYQGVVVSGRLPISASLIQAGRQLRFIARAGSGMDHIDVAFANQRQIQCINAGEGNANAVAEHALGLLLAFYHNLFVSVDQTRMGQWRTAQLRTDELEGKTIGIIGYGNTGSAFAWKLAPFGMRILAYDKYKSGFGSEVVTESNLAAIQQQATIVSLHVPLTEETTCMVGEEFLSGFQHPIFLINTARGGLIDYPALLHGLQTGRVQGAVCDVYANEDFDNHTEQERQWFFDLIATGRVYFTPHIAGKSAQAPEKIARVLVGKIRDLYFAVSQ